MRRVGLLGGAFNPPHEGHLKLAHLALAHLRLDELRLVPTAQSPHQPDPGGASPEARGRLVAEALAGQDPRLRLEPLELRRGGTSYTVDTLEALAAREPGTGWILVMGADQVPGLPTWRRVDRILALASLAVAARPGAPAPVPVLPGLTPVTDWSGGPGEWLILPSTDLDLASTDLRARLAARPDAAPEGLPAQVVAAIRSENLYR